LEVELTKLEWKDREPPVILAGGYDDAINHEDEVHFEQCINIPIPEGMMDRND
jgi:hypothetical protein